MHWERIRRTAGLVALIGFLLFWLDFLAFGVIGHAIGGCYFYGHAAGGHYDLAHRASGPFTPVSAWIYSYSVCHYWSIILLAWTWGPAALLALLTHSVCRHRITPLEIRVTPEGISLNESPSSLEEVMAALRATRQIPKHERPMIRVRKAYPPNETPPHAVAFQIALREEEFLLPQQQDRWPR